MKRILFMIFNNFFRVPFLWIKLCSYAAHPEKHTETEHYAMVKHIVKRGNIGGNVSIMASGIENIPKDGGCIMYPNHQGLYDVLAIMDVCPRPFSVVAKKEVAHLQFLKQVFACLGAYTIDRNNIRQSMEIIQKVAEEVTGGRMFLIFPEGTRSRKGNEVQKFKGGSFKAATKARCPIVPVALVDAFKPFDTNSIKRVTVQVHFLEPLLYEDYKDMKTVEIAEIVRDRIVKEINERI